MVTHPQAQKSMVGLAIIDDQATMTMLDTAAIENMGLPNSILKKDTLSTITVQGQSPRESCLKVSGLQVASLKGTQNKINLPPTYLHKTLVNASQEVPTRRQVAGMPGFEHFADKFYDDVSNLKTIMLIGRNCILAQRQRQFTNSRNQNQIATETPLGWCIMGKSAPIAMNRSYADATKGATRQKAPDHRMRESQTVRPREPQQGTQTRKPVDKKQTRGSTVFVHSGLKNTVPTKSPRQTQEGPIQKPTQPVNSKPRQQQSSENKKATVPTNPGIQNPRPTAQSEEPREVQTQPTTPVLDIEEIEDICSEIGIADITEVDTDEQTVRTSDSAQTPMTELNMGNSSDQTDSSQINTEEQAVLASDSTQTPMTEQDMGESSDQTGSPQENTGERALLTSQDQTDSQSAVPDTGHDTAPLSQSEHQETESMPTKPSGSITHPTETDDEEEGAPTRTSKRPNPLKEQHKVLICGLDTDLDYYDPDGPEVDLTDALEYTIGPVKNMQIERLPSPQGEYLRGDAEVAFYTKEDAMACLDASAGGQLCCHGKRLHAKAIEQVTEKPTIAATVLRTSETHIDENTKAPETGNATQAIHSGPRYKVLFSKLDCDLRHYTPDGPEEDLKQMLEFYYGPVLSVIMKRSSTPLGECLLGTAEVTLATPKAAQKCIKASDEKWLELHGRHLHAKMA